MTSSQELVSRVIERLKEQLPAYLLEDGISDVRQYLDYDPPTITNNQPPLIWVDIARQVKDTNPTHGASLNYYSNSQTLLIGVVVAGTDPSKVVFDLRGAADRIRQTLDQSQWDAPPLFFLWQSTDQSQTHSHKNSLLKTATLTFEAKSRVGRGQN